MSGGEWGCAAWSGRGRGLAEGGGCEAERSGIVHAALWSLHPSLLAPPLSPPLLPSPPLALSRPSPSPHWLSSSPSTVHLGRRVQGQGEGERWWSERERGRGEGARGRGGSEGREMGEGREWALQSLPPPKRDEQHMHTHTHTIHSHTHTANTLTMAAPTREEVIRTSTGEGTHRCSPASPRKSAEKQPSSLRIQPSSKDIVVEDASAQVSMKSAANCETSCDPQDLVNHRILERLTLRG